MKIARQKIVDTDMNVVAYEVLYRNGRYELGKDDDDKITLDVIEASFSKVGYSNMTRNQERLTFNFAHGELLRNISESLAPQNVIIEILESVEINSELIQTLKSLKEKGFVIALDDFKVELVMDEEIYNYVDIIKVDFLYSSIKERRKIEKLKEEFPHIVLLAEKIENEIEYCRAIESGYTLFQGYFISKPEVIDVNA